MTDRLQEIRDRVRTAHPDDGVHHFPVFDLNYLLGLIAQAADDLAAATQTIRERLPGVSTGQAGAAGTGCAEEPAPYRCRLLESVASFVQGRPSS